MDFGDIGIYKVSTRSVSTYGTLHVARKGFLNSPRIRCGSARIEGRIAGSVECAGAFRLAAGSSCRIRIRAGSLLIDPGARLNLPYAATIGSGFVRGRVEGAIVCSGTLRLGRGAEVLGDLEVKSLIIDKGAMFSGDVCIDPKNSPVPGKPPPPEKTPGTALSWLRRVAISTG